MEEKKYLLYTLHFERKELEQGFYYHGVYNLIKRSNSKLLLRLYALIHCKRYYIIIIDSLIISSEDLINA